LDNGQGIVVDFGGNISIAPTHIVKDLILALQVEVDRANALAIIAAAEREAQAKADAAQEEQAVVSADAVEQDTPAASQSLPAAADTPVGG
jgi:hypothetical protein